MKQIICLFTLLTIATHSIYGGISTQQKSAIQGKKNISISLEQKEGNKIYNLKLPKTIHKKLKKLPSPIKTTIGIIGMTVWIAGYFMLLEYMFPIK